MLHKYNTYSFNFESYYLQLAKSYLVLIKLRITLMQFKYYNVPLNIWLNVSRFTYNNDKFRVLIYIFRYLRWNIVILMFHEIWAVIWKLNVK